MFDVMIIIGDMVVWAGLLGVLALSLWGSHSLWRARTRMKAHQGAVATYSLQGGMALINAVLLAATIAAVVVEVVYGVRLVVLLLGMLFAAG